MTQAGLDVIESAKRNGSWTILDTVEDLIIPDDLEKAFQKHKGSKEFFLSLSKSVKINDVTPHRTCQTSRNPT